MTRKEFLGGIACCAAGVALAAPNNADGGSRTRGMPFPKAGDFDVVVIGGSCTGVFAAIRAAEAGCRVALVEMSGDLPSGADVVDCDKVAVASPGRLGDVGVD